MSSVNGLTAADVEMIRTNIDQFFLVIFGMCVLFMQCGFAFLEAGAVRSKNVTNILIKNVFDSFVSGVAYWLFGYAFAFGDGNDFIGYKFFASSDLPDTSYASFFFQYTFAATAATIVSGAVAERCEFVAYFVYSFFITGFIYPVVTHWQWGGGFLSKGKDYDDIGNVAYVKYDVKGGNNQHPIEGASLESRNRAQLAKDFAGSGLVHVLGGTAAFIGAVLLGPRIGRFHKQTNTAIPIRGHSIPIAALGGFILFFGFLAFNGGSQTQIANDGDGAVVSLAVVNTVISGSFAAFSSLLINRIHIFGTARWSLLITINGALTGMVAACAGCDSMYPWGACILGCVSGVVFHIYSALLRKLHVDDPLDAVAVHFGGGSWGVIAIAFLHKDIGILMEHNKKSGLFLAWQLAGLAVITGWTAVLCLILFGLLKITKLLRVPQEIELKGLDIPKHNEPAYPVEAYGHGHIEKILQIMESNPTYVTQLFKRLSQSGQHGEHTNPAFQAHLEDVGPYESPEVNAINRANRNGVTVVKPNTSANNGDTAVYIPAERL